MSSTFLNEVWRIGRGAVELFQYVEELTADEEFHRRRIVEEMMDNRTYCETIAGLLRKPIVKLLRNLKVSRNVKWIYQEGISI